jgi:outer membrane protein assembly factor BamB
MKHLPSILAICLSLCESAGAAESWSRFRGPAGTGHYSGPALPTKWGPENVLWRVEIKGEGHSSPCSWQQRIFLTSATDQARTRLVLALDSRDGRRLWEKTISCASPEKTHRLNSFATPTCATDGERIVAFFANAGIHCFNLDGKPLWSQSLGEFAGPWGIAASPVLVGDRVIQNCDAQGASFLAGLDAKTGKIVWRTPRTDKPMGGWSTPVTIRTGARTEVILNSQSGVDAYDPATGKPLWHCRGFGGRGEPAPDYAHGMLFVLNGNPGDVYAVRPGGSGEVSDTHRVWHTPRKRIRDVSSPIVVGKYLFAIDMKGLATTYDATSGAELWSQRIAGAFTASPVEASGLIYLNDEAGQTLVIRPGPKLDLLARNSLGDHSDELFRASLAPIDGRIYFRSSRALYCVDVK